MAVHVNAANSWYSLGAAASHLGVHPTTLRRWANRGTVSFTMTPGGHRRFSGRELDQLLADHLVADSVAAPASPVQVEGAPVVCIGVDHRAEGWLAGASLTAENAAALLGKARRLPGIDATVVLATCNRTEIYAAGPAPDTARLSAALRNALGVNPQPPVYLHSGPAAVTHLVRVACGLESMVIGETEILGQVSRAWEGSRAAGTSGSALDALFQVAVRAGRRARSQTDISRFALSVGGVAVEFAATRVDDFGSQRVAVIGTGATAQVVVKGLSARGVTEVTVVSRDPARAQSVATAWNCRGVSMGQLEEVLAEHGVVFCAGAAPGSIDTPYLSGRRLTIIDLGAPPNTTARMRTARNTTVFGLSDLQDEADRALGRRRDEVPKVEAIVNEEAAGFELWLREAKIRPVIASLRKRAEELRRTVLEQALSDLAQLSPQDQKQVVQLSHSLVNRLLDEPTRRLRSAFRDENWQEQVRVVERLFGIERR